MDFKNKYLKYKQKYLELKNNQYGAELKIIMNMDPSFVKPYIYDDLSKEHLNIIYTELEKILATNPDIFILKIGSNDIVGGARCDRGTCTHYIYNDANIIITNSLKIIELNKLNKLNKLMININKNTNKCIKILQIDPNNETYAPFDLPINYDHLTIENILGNIKIDKDIEYKFLKTYFPLARDLNPEESIVNKIIDLLVNYEGVLILYNAIGSQCYGIFKTIIDMRKLKGKKIIYGGVANVAIDTDCEINKPKFILDGDKFNPIPDSRGAINY
jgi:hypothetical protein